MSRCALTSLSINQVISLTVCVACLLFLSRTTTRYDQIVTLPPDTHKDTDTAAMHTAFGIPAISISYG
jgi:hypothetical protein